MNVERPLRFALLFIAAQVAAQPNFTANDQVPPYPGPFGFGANLNYYPPWNDLQVADIAFGNPSVGVPGIGLKCFRGSLPEYFLNAWGFDIRVSYYEHYASLGAGEHLVFIGYPEEAHRDPTEYCPGVPSKLFDKLYEPIWDGGANGTPVNDANYYALYVWKMVNQYKDHVRFWEVWSEPDFTWNTALSYSPPGSPGNWWDNNPGPCDQETNAPIFHYIRLLRITYEVVKSIDPTAYVCTGGLGNPAFLDAICRNTDNPVDGSIAAQYPLKGGAYFDVLDIHSYPHFDGSLREYVNSSGWVYHRHSDRAMSGMASRMNTMDEVTADYGYDGLVYPKKLRLISETNLPRKAFNTEYLGSSEAQRNYLMKALVEAQRQRIEQVYFYLIADLVPEPSAVYEFQTMGLFKNLSQYTYPNYEVNEEATALKTTSDFLYGMDYDEAMSTALALPTGIDGAAFTSSSDTVIVLWAKTTTDLSEQASGSYTFPVSFQFDTLMVWQWDFSASGASQLLPGSTVQLTGAPSFVRGKPARPIIINGTAGIAEQKPSVQLAPNPTSGSLRIGFQNMEPGNLTLSVYDLAGRLVHEKQVDLLLRNQVVGIDLGGLAAGVYCLKIATFQRVIVERFFIQR